MPVFGGAGQLKVLVPEDIIGLKIQVLANDPERTHREYADKESLLDLYRDKINWNVLKEYFTMFDKWDKCHEFKKKYKKKDAKS